MQIVEKPEDLIVTPIPLEKLMSMSRDRQRLYFKVLLDQYGVTYAMVGEALGLSKATVQTLARDLGIKFKRKTAPDHHWDRWKNGQEVISAFPVRANSGVHLYMWFCPPD